jgi:hypothetical protein
MHAAYLRNFVDQSSRRLLQVSIPPVRYWLLRDVMGRDESDIILRRTVEECESFPARLRLLNAIREDGTWPILKHQREQEEREGGPPMGFTYSTMLINLYKLLQMRTEVSEGKVSKSLERILGWQTEEGYIPGTWTNLFPIPYWNAFAAHDLVRFGMGEDPRVKKLVSWLLSMQRADGGWNIPYYEDVKYLPRYRRIPPEEFVKVLKEEGVDKHDPKQLQRFPSCTWSTVQVLWGLVESDEVAGSRAARRAGQFVLDRFLQRNPHPSFYPTVDHWFVFRYPPNTGGGLPALQVLTRLGFGPDNPKMDVCVRWLVDQRGEDYFWHRTQGSHPTSDQWITLIALQVLSEYLKRL